MNEEWLTKKELAAELKVSRRTIERLHLPSMKVGGQHRFKLSEVYLALNGSSVGDNVVALRPRRREKAA